jgi:hypothetical protein
MNAVGVSVLFVVLFAATTARADDQEEARRHFDAGLEARASGDLERAEGELVASLALVENASTAFNLALVLHERGRPLRALELVEELVAGRYGELPPEATQEIELLRERAEATVARAAITIRGVRRAEVSVDGQRIATVAERTTIEHRLDPGEHVVRAESDGAEASEERFTLAPRARLEIALELVPIPIVRETPPVAIAPIAEDEDESSFPWGWLLVGTGAALAIAGGIVAVVLLTSGQDHALGTHTALMR